jgi:4-hydroxy-2-oxoheptanedioate aldolase
MGVPAGYGLWLSTPNATLLEMAAKQKVDALVLDIEHGTFDIATLDTVLLIAKSLGLAALAKVAAPDRASIQQPLDFGAAGVIIPHVGDADHAASVTAFAKFPPHGSRSFAGGRTVDYDAPGPEFFDVENKRTVCLPMIETAEALEAVEEIAALATVDGLFVGPSDLSLRRGRGRYRRTDADRNDLERIAKAADAAGKPWIMPAWSAEEQQWARDLGARLQVIAEEQAILADGLAVVFSTIGAAP